MLTLQNVTHVYANGTRALDDATLTIPKGMFGLLGPNGAGKSTLMRCIATLQAPSSGSIHFDDIDVITAPEQLRAVLGYLPQRIRHHLRAR
jgi:ABC-2 type transport system ATP-binding protein